MIECIERILAEGEEAVLPEQNAAPGEQPAESTATPTAHVAIDELSEATAASGAAAESRALSYAQGSSSKFWNISRAGAELTVTYGRTGTQGQRLIKSHESEERAQREMEKLVAEKLRKGYVDAP